mgnify:CR=1 FL=1
MTLPQEMTLIEITTPGGVRNTDEFTLSVGQSAVLDFDFSQPDIAEGGDDADFRARLDADRAQAETGGKLRGLATGPHDVAPLFDRFIEAMAKRR